MKKSYSSTYLSALLIGVFVIMVAVAGVVGIHKYRTLGFDPGSTYLLGLAARTFDPTLSKVPIGDMSGHNMFLMAGPRSMQIDMRRDVHFEPVVYVTAALYSVTHSESVLIFFYILLFFSPLLYGAWLIYTDRVKWPGALLAVLMLYALFPNSVMRATDDFRPFMLIAPSFFLCMLTLFYRRSTAEKLIFLNLLLAAREEGLVLALAAIAYEYARERREKSTHRTSLLFGISWLVWAAAVGAYMAWIQSDYAFRGPLVLGDVLLRATLLPHAWVYLGLLSSVAVGWAAWRYRRAWLPYTENAVLICYALALFVLIPLFNLNQGLDGPGFERNRLSIFIWVLVLVLLLSFSTRDEPMRAPRITGRATRVLFSLAGLLILFFVYIQAGMIIYKLSTLSVYSARLVFEARTFIPQDSAVLVDRETAALFYNYKEPVVLARFLGPDVRSDPEDFYPGNEARLIEGLKYTFRYVVVTTAYRDIAEELSRKAGTQLKVLRENRSYGLYEVQR